MTLTPSGLPHSWTAVDLLALNAEPPAPPTIGGLVYPGHRHVFSGEPESLKTWAALVLAAGELAEGRAVAWVDFETGNRAMLARLRDLGLDDEAIRRFLYVSPNEAMAGATIVRDLHEMLAEFRPSLVVVDAFTGALELQGLDPNKGVEVERFYRTVVKPLQEFDAAALLLDHVVKNKEARGKFSIGAERKLGGSDVHLGFEVVQPFSRGRVGRVKITTHKDRPGYLPRPRAAELELVSDGDTGRVTWAWHIAEDNAGSDTEFFPTVLMERVSRWLEEQTDPVSRSDIEG